MAWQSKQGGYDNYGGYVDSSYGPNDQQNPQYYGGHQTGMVSKNSKSPVMSQFTCWPFLEYFCPLPIQGKETRTF